MNKANKVLMGIPLGIATFYIVMSFVITLLNIIETSTYSFYLFNPFELIEGSSFQDAGINVLDHIPLELVTSYNEFLSNYWVHLGIEEKYAISLFVALGFIMVVAGIISKPTRDLKGDDDNPKEYLFTARPKSILKCIKIPWNIFVITWRFHKIPVIIPILFIPFIAPFAIVMDVILFVLFIIIKAIVGLKIKSASKKDRVTYSINIGYAVCQKCKRNFYQPKVKCKCGLIVDYPVPGPYGINNHSCNNGHTLPSTNKNNAREKLGVVCPYCRSDIHTHEAKSISISLVGGIGSGKTTLMLAATEAICSLAKEKTVVTELMTKGLSVKAMENKEHTEPTAQGELDSEYYFIRSRDMPEKRIIVNDISGKEFEPDPDKNIFQEYYKYNDGIIFTIDPRAVVAIHNSNAPNKGSKITPKMILDTFYGIYVTVNGCSPSFKSEVPFAVVITNVDNPVMKQMLDVDSPEQFLINNGQEDFVRALQQMFTTVKYFAVSSTGKDKSSIEPFKWIFCKSDNDLKSRLF